MRVSRNVAGSVLLSGALLVGTAVLSGVTGAAPAGASACATTNTHKYEVTATGEKETTNTHEVKCGKNYQKWTVKATRTRVGATTVTDTYRDEFDYPHYVQDVHKVATSAKGVVTVTNTVTRA
jgi:hypothetical protein